MSTRLAAPDGGAYRYLWRNEALDQEFGPTGEHREIVAPERLVTTERLDGLAARL